MPTLLLPSIHDVSPELVRGCVIYMTGLILSIAVHEHGHARVADYLGDTLPRRQKRVTLNPISHIDLWGTILFPLLMFVSAAAGTSLPLLGWGKPVQVSLAERRYRHGLSRRGAHFVIAAAGPLSNLAFGVVLSVVYVILRRAGVGGDGMMEVFGALIIMNIGLACFNLIPCPPLDGGALLTSVLPAGHPVTRFIERYGFIIFFALFFTGVLAYVMLPASLLGAAWLRHVSAWAG